MRQTWTALPNAVALITSGFCVQASEPPPLLVSAGPPPLSTSSAGARNASFRRLYARNTPSRRLALRFPAQRRFSLQRPRAARRSRSAAAAVSASHGGLCGVWSTISDVGAILPTQASGPNHLGLWLNQAAAAPAHSVLESIRSPCRKHGLYTAHSGPNHLGLRLIVRRRRRRRHPRRAGAGGHDGGSARCRRRRRWGPLPLVTVYNCCMGYSLRISASSKQL